MPRSQKALKYLLENGATLFIDDMQNEFGKTPLMIACSNGRPSEELAMLLLKFGADPKCKKASRGSIGYTAYDFSLQIDTKEFKPSSEFIEVLRVATL
jgi:ankyrin repeat protein